VHVATEDAAHVLLRLEDGARAAMTVSQIAAGRRNQLAFEVDCSEGSVAWNSERNEELFLGRRGRPKTPLALRKTTPAPGIGVPTPRLLPPNEPEGWVPRDDAGPRG